LARFLRHYIGDKMSLLRFIPLERQRIFSKFAQPKN
jgi:hypothetical protein